MRVLGLGAARESARTRDEPLSRYPPGFLDQITEISERNHAFHAFVTAADGGEDAATPTMESLAMLGSWRKRERWTFPLGTRGPRAARDDAHVLDACHPRLKSAADGCTLLEPSALRAACGPGIVALFVNGSFAIEAAALRRRSAHARLGPSR